MFYRWIILTLAFIALSVNALDIKLSGNVSSDVDISEFSYRQTTMVTFSAGGLAGGAYFHSVGVDVEGSSADVDGIWGAAGFVAGRYPFNWLAYFNSDIEFDGSTDWASADITASAGYIGVALLKLEEVDSSGKVVKSTPLKGKFVIGSGVEWKRISESTTGDLKYATWEGSNDDVSVKYTILVSAVVGKLNLGAYISPKSMESVIEINGWKYADNNNQLRLVQVVASGAATASGNAFISGSGLDQVYYTLATNVDVDGTNKAVTIEFEGATSTALDDVDIKGQLDAKYGAKADIKLVKITFPAGADNIVYDPSMGAGSPLNGSAFGLVPAFSVLFFALFAFLF